MSQTIADPKEQGQKPPFKEPKQSVPGSSEQMQNQPDYGEKSYTGYGRLKGRRALITGADSGIGRAVALAFAREGADVAISYWKEHEDAHVTERVVKEAGRGGLLLPGDLTEEQTCRRIVEDTVKQF